jgi:predicted nucleic acid-binding protein
VKPSHLLDTSVFCQPLKRKPLPQVVACWKALGDNALCTSIICEAEVLFGIEKSASQRLRVEYEEVLLGRLPIIGLDRQVICAYAQIKADLMGKGLPRPEFDLLIAATARVHSLVVATLDRAHFSDIAGVVVEDWSGT